ncbi:MAG: molybdopterin converting factor subunit 1 [Verrucomicrobiota bacterium]
MKVRVLFFSVIEELIGADSRELSLPPGSSVEGLWEVLSGEYPALESWRGRCLVAVNCEYADFSTALGDGDEVALMPPVQGG